MPTFPCPWIRKSDKATGRARSMQALEGDRYRVVYDEHRRGAAEDGQNKTFDVRSARIIHVVDRGACCIIVCGPTQDFRYLCRTQVTCEDTVLEIGCSYGKASKVLAEQLGLDAGGGIPLYNGGGGDRLICVDISSEGISSCKILNKGRMTNAPFLRTNSIARPRCSCCSLFFGYLCSVWPIIAMRLPSPHLGMFS